MQLAIGSSGLHLQWNFGWYFPNAAITLTHVDLGELTVFIRLYYVGVALICLKEPKDPSYTNRLVEVETKYSQVHSRVNHKVPPYVIPSSDTTPNQNENTHGEYADPDPSRKPLYYTSRQPSKAAKVSAKEIATEKKAINLQSSI